MNPACLGVEATYYPNAERMRTLINISINKVKDLLKEKVTNCGTSGSVWDNLKNPTEEGIRCLLLLSTPQTRGIEAEENEVDYHFDLAPKNSLLEEEEDISSEPLNNYSLT